MQRQILAAAALCAVTAASQATPITVTTPFFNLEHINVNSLGFGNGSFVRLGANSVVPNGDGGTTGLATRNSDGFARTLFPAPLPVLPNFFRRTLTDNPALYRGDWTLTFTNGRYER